MSSALRARDGDRVVHSADVQIQWDWPSAVLPYCPFFLIVVGHVLGVYLLARATGLLEVHYFGLYSDAMASVSALTFCVLFLLYLGRLLWIEKEPQPTRRIACDVRRYVLNGRNVLAVGVCLLALPVFIASFTSFKSMMPILNPFHLDPFFAELDRLLHGGIDPWRLTHAVFGSSTATYLIGGVYFLWFPVLWGFFVWHAFRLNRPADRQQYMLCFVLSWTVIGSIMAYLMISGGPCFYGRITGDEAAFGPLMARLWEIDESLRAAGLHLLALQLQDELWAQLSANSLGIGTGISAMPSMHVSVAVLMALAAWRYHRGLGAVMIAFAVLIQIGSVHLGWHYAIDGYLAAAVTVALWKVSGWIVRRLGAPEEAIVRAGQGRVTVAPAPSASPVR